jgi:hypothetical protein
VTGIILFILGCSSDHAIYYVINYAINKVLLQELLVSL